MSFTGNSLNKDTAIDPFEELLLMICDNISQLQGLPRGLDQVGGGGWRSKHSCSVVGKEESEDMIVFIICLMASWIDLSNSGHSNKGSRMSKKSR